jgi:F-box protein 21
MKIEGYLDKLVEKICYSIEDIQTLSIRAKSLAIVRYLRANGFNGVADERWNDLRNNFIGIALRQKEHQCLPLVSVGIFCAVARRLGLDARPCGFPFRVHAIVQGLPNESLNAVRASIRGMPNQSPNSGRSLEGGDGTVERIFLDPSRSSDEVSLESLRAQVRALGFDVSEVSVHLLDSPVSGMVHRAARNIAKAVKELNLALEMTNPNSLEPLPDMYPSKKDARYSALWALVVLEAMQLGTEPGMSMAERRQNINHMLFELSADFPCDISLLEDHVVPFFQGFEERTELNDIINAMQSTDRIPKEVKSRKVLDQDGSVKYRVGQIFKHKRYRYFGIITGWDRSCVQEEDWIQQMNVDALPNGRNQSFYHVL